MEDINFDKAVQIKNQLKRLEYLKKNIQIDEYKVKVFISDKYNSVVGEQSIIDNEIKQCISVSKSIIMNKIESEIEDLTKQFKSL